MHERCPLTSSSRGIFFFIILLERGCSMYDNEEYLYIALDDDLFPIEDKDEKQDETRGDENVVSV